MQLIDVRLLRQELEEYKELRALLPRAGSWKAAALERKLRRMGEELAAQLWEIACFVEQISDPELRLIFELRYFRGRTWREVAAGLPTDLSPDGARMKHDRYLKKLEETGGIENGKWKIEN